MALKAVLDSLDGLPEAVAKEYKKVDDDQGTRYLLDTEGVEDVTGLKSALGKVRQDNNKLTKLVKKIGLKPDDETALTALQEKLGDKTIDEVLEELSSKPGETTEAVTKALRPLQRQLTEKDEALTQQQAFIDRLVRENQLRDVLAKPEHEGNALLLMPHLLKHTKIVEEDGTDGGKEYVAKVIDPKTKDVRLKGGKEMTLDDLVAEFKANADFSSAFAGTGASGSGAEPSRRTPAGGGSGSRAAGTGLDSKRRSPTYSAI